MALILGAVALPAAAQPADEIRALNERLFEAVRKNDMGTVRSVLTSGADPMAIDGSGQTPAGLAVERGYFDIAHYILSVRNQRQAMRERSGGETDAATPAAAPRPAAPAASAESVREPPTPSWRANAEPGQPAEVPAARLTRPGQPVVVRPAEPKRPPAPNAKAAKRPGAAPATPVPPAASQPSEPPLANLPRLPSGTPNPFDPRTAEPVAPPAAVAAPLPGTPPASVPPSTASGESEPPARSGTRNPFSRLWNGVTDLFSRRAEPSEPQTPLAPPAPPRSSSVGPPAQAPHPRTIDAPDESTLHLVPSMEQAALAFLMMPRPEPVETTSTHEETPRVVPAAVPAVDLTESPAATPTESKDDPLARFLTSLFRRGAPTDVAAAEELPPAAPKVTTPDATAEANSDLISKFFAKLFRRNDVPQAEQPIAFETAAGEAPPAAAPAEAEAAPMSHQQTVEMGADSPLPIVVDPTLVAPDASSAPSRPVASPAAAPAAATAHSEERGFARMIGSLLRAFARAGEAAGSPPAPSAPPTSVVKYSAPAAVQLAGLTPFVEQPQRAAVVPSVAPPAATGPLGIGESFSLGRSLSPAELRARNCFQKGRLPGRYCLETVAWPAEIAERMNVGSWLYGRGRIVVHYSNAGAVQSLFAPFPTEQFNHIVRYLEAQLGPATGDSSRRVALIGEPAKLNLITSWNRREADGVHAVLEAHKFDTVRSMIPDTKLGFLSLSRQGATPIFRYVSDADLMMQSMRMGSDAAGEPSGQP